MALDITGKVGWWSGSVNVAPSQDADALAFITAANITDTTQKSAINTLVTQLKTYGIWTKLKAVYPFVGGTASSHKFNLKDPRDLDAAFRLVFNGGWTHSSTGALPNGTNGYADTKFNPNSQSMSLSSFHLSNYARTAMTSGTSRVYMGVESTSTSDITLLGWVNSGTQEGGSIGGANTGTQYSPSPALSPSTAGFKTLLTNGNRNARFFRNGAYQSNQVLQTYNSPNYNLYLSAINRDSLTAGAYNNTEQAFASIGDGLTDTEAANFYTAVQTFQTTLGRQVGVPIVADTDAQAFLNAAVITNQTQANAINTLVTDLKSANIWTKMKAIYPFVGGTATTHKFNLKDPRDLDAAYRLTFSGGWTHSSTGALPNGTNAYADTFLAPQATLSQNSTHISYYSRTNNDVGIEMGARYPNTNPSQIYLGVKYGGNVISRLNSLSTPGSVPNTDGRGLYLLSRIDSSGYGSFKNTTKTFVTQTSQSIPAQSITIGAYYENLWYYSTKESAFASIGDGLTDAEATAFYNAVQAYQTTLSRNV